MRYFMYGSDYYTSWILYMLPAMLIAFWAQTLIKSRFEKYSKVGTDTNYTGAEVARMILDRNGLYNVKIERVSGDLSDHYDPSSKILRLSNQVYGGDNIAAFGVAAHEVGHALQDAQGYWPLKVRRALVPVVNLGNSLVWPMIFIGIAVSSVFIELAVALFLAVVLFQFITLPVEINASKRALLQLENGILPGDKIQGAKKVLQAAAMTYIAAILVSLGQLFRILSYVNRRRD